MARRNWKIDFQYQFFWASIVEISSLLLIRSTYQRERKLRIINEHEPTSQIALRYFFTLFYQMLSEPKISRKFCCFPNNTNLEDVVLKVRTTEYLT